MKHYKLLITASKRVIVKNCKDQEEALEVADLMLNFGDLELDEAKVEGSVKKQEIEAEERCGAEVYDAKEVD